MPGFQALIVWGFWLLFMIVPVVYFLVITTRLMNAVERIAKKLESSSLGN